MMSPTIREPEPLGLRRPVHNGRVSCPLRGPVDVATCFVCPAWLGLTTDRIEQVLCGGWDEGTGPSGDVIPPPPEEPSPADPDRIERTFEALLGHAAAEPRLAVAIAAVVRDVLPSAPASTVEHATAATLASLRTDLGEALATCSEAELERLAGRRRRLDLGWD